MAATQSMLKDLTIDASWDHAMLSDEDALWLQQQQGQEDQMNNWLDGFLDLDSLETEYGSDSCATDYEDVSPRGVDFPLYPAHESISCAPRDAYEEYFAKLDTTKMTKAELRKHKNRASAARSRQRTRQRMEQLEQLVCQLANKKRQLEQTLNVLQYQQLAAHGATLPTSMHPHFVAH